MNTVCKEAVYAKVGRLVIVTSAIHPACEVLDVRIMELRKFPQKKLDRLRNHGRRLYHRAVRYEYRRVRAPFPEDLEKARHISPPFARAAELHDVVAAEPDEDVIERLAWNHRDKLIDRAPRGDAVPSDHRPLDRLLDPLAQLKRELPR